MTDQNPAVDPEKIRSIFADSQNDRYDNFSSAMLFAHTHQDPELKRAGATQFAHLMLGLASTAPSTEPRTLDTRINDVSQFIEQSRHEKRPGADAPTQPSTDA